MHCYRRTSPQRPPWEQKKLAVVERWPLRGGRGVIGQNFFREYNIFIVLISCLLHSIMVLQSYIIHCSDKIHKKSNNLFESKCLDVTKRARFAAFAISIVDNLCCLLQQFKWSTIKIQLTWIINAPYASNVMTILDFFINC